jgi:hypothetical protein
MNATCCGSQWRSYKRNHGRARPKWSTQILFSIKTLHYTLVTSLFLHWLHICITYIVPYKHYIRRYTKYATKRSYTVAIQNTFSSVLLHTHTHKKTHLVQLTNQFIDTCYHIDKLLTRNLRK